MIDDGLVSLSSSIGGEGGKEEGLSAALIGAALWRRYGGGCCRRGRHRGSRDRGQSPTTQVRSWVDFEDNSEVGFEVVMILTSKEK